MTIATKRKVARMYTAFDDRGHTVRYVEFRCGCIQTTDHDEDGGRPSIALCRDCQRSEESQP